MNDRPRVLVTWEEGAAFSKVVRSRCIVQASGVCWRLFLTFVVRPVNGEQPHL